MIVTNKNGEITKNIMIYYSMSHDERRKEYNISKDKLDKVFELLNELGNLDFSSIINYSDIIDFVDDLRSRIDNIDISNSRNLEILDFTIINILSINGRMDISRFYLNRNMLKNGITEDIAKLLVEDIVTDYDNFKFMLSSDLDFRLINPLFTDSHKTILENYISKLKNDKQFISTLNDKDKFNFMKNIKKLNSILKSDIDISRYMIF